MGNEVSRCVENSGSIKANSKAQQPVRREGKIEEIVLQNAANVLSDFLKPKKLIPPPIDRKREPKKEYYKVSTFNQH